MYTTSTVISEDQKGVVLKKSVNPFSEMVNDKVNDVDLWPLLMDHPPSNMSYEREFYA